MERDQPQIGYKYVQIYFNSHAHVERDKLELKRRNGYEYFNSHAHVERDSLIWRSVLNG